MDRPRFYRAWLVIALIGTFAAPSSGANLHFVLLADTLDTQIGTGDDLKILREWATEIAQETGLTLNLQELSGNSLTVDNVKSVLNNLDPGSDDVVYFHYSGHGGNPGSLTWPVFYFTASDYYDTPVSFDNVVELLKPKNPRLLVVMGDCCNNYPDQSRLSPPTGKILGFDYGPAFQTLFLTYQGTVLGSGASPGQFSFGSEGYGGLFTNAMRDEFYKMAESGLGATWESLLGNVKSNVSKATNGYDPPQVPQFVVQAGQVAGHTPDDLDLDDEEDQEGNGVLEENDDTENNTGGGGISPDGVDDSSTGDNDDDSDDAEENSSISNQQDNESNESTNGTGTGGTVTVPGCGFGMTMTLGMGLAGFVVLRRRAEGGHTMDRTS